MGSGLLLVRRPLESSNLPAQKFYSTVMAPKKVCIVGSGNWGSAIARLVGFNAARLPERFQKEVAMWVFEEEVNGRKLTEIINTDHENFIGRACAPLKGKLKPEAQGLSLVKG